MDCDIVAHVASLSRLEVLLRVKPLTEPLLLYGGATLEDD